MKKTLLLLLSILLIGCSPFVDKELRKKNRCNRKFDRKFKRLSKRCDISSIDTLISNLDTTIVTNEVRVDTLVSTKHDTIEIIKDKFRVRIVNLIDTLLIEGGCDADTVVITKTVKVPYKVVTPVKLTILDHIANYFSKLWWLLLVVLAIYFVYKKLLN